MRILPHVLICLCVGLATCAPLPSDASPEKRNHSTQPDQAASQSQATLGTERQPLTVRVLTPDLEASELARLDRERTEKAESDAKLVNYTMMLAVFTAVLAISTIGLWWVTKGLRDFAAEQAKDMKSSIAVAKQSANAAEAVARSAVAVDLPILVVENVNCGQRAAQATVRIGNHGRTPAIVISDCLVLSLDRALADQPRYPISCLAKPDRPRIVEAKHVYDLQRPCAVTEDEWKRVFAGETILWAYGYVEYIDFLKCM